MVSYLCVPFQHSRLTLDHTIIDKMYSIMFEVNVLSCSATLGRANKMMSTKFKSITALLTDLDSLEWPRSFQLFYAQERQHRHLFRDQGYQYHHQCQEMHWNIGAPLHVSPLFISVKTALYDGDVIERSTLWLVAFC